ncbi:uncharacterized protein LOC142772294 [Rhipicephalus microplus]|uniref:uncharacterized protein LOC142772294 n=1 Tax=Rhipicephalus microplus TaxID=6941 RepID=UPI003F6AAD58
MYWIFAFELILLEMKNASPPPLDSRSCSQPTTCGWQYAERHQMIHTGERPYKCNYCSRAFFHNSHLTTHIRIHTGQRPYQCHLCLWNSAHTHILKTCAVVQASQLIWALGSFHHADLAAVRRRPGWPPHVGSLTEERVFKCQVCGYTTRYRLNLRRHQIIHTGERPFKCGYCGKTFIQKTHMVGHIRTHTGERPYQCHLCPWNTARKSHLTRHFKTHKCSQHSPQGAHG